MPPRSWLNGSRLKHRKWPSLKKTSLARISKTRGRQRSLRKQLWPEFSRLIRQRDGHCLMQGQSWHMNCGGVLQGSHIHAKGDHPLLELYPLNVKTLCWRAHWWWHHNPLLAATWFKATFPQWWQDRLEQEKQNSLARKGMTREQHYAEWRLYGLTP